jgi:disulfide bond formation protein DsbB
VSTSPAEPSPSPFIYIAWVVALLSTLGTLFFGEVMKLPPCALCWYQRICMFPLVVVLAVGILRRDRQVGHYALPLAGAGLALAVYHNLLYYGVISERLAPCTQGVPCTQRQIEWLGFVTIPLMALAAFAVILGCLIVHQRLVRRAPK